MVLYSPFSILAEHGAVHCFMLYKMHGRKKRRFGSACFISSLHVRNLNIFCNSWNNIFLRYLKESSRKVKIWYLNPAGYLCLDCHLRLMFRP